MMGALRSAWSAGVLQPVDLSPERLRAMAEKDTGLTADLSDRALFEDKLAVLLPSLHEEARLTDFGRLVSHGSLLKLMKDRLRFEAIMAEHPEIDRIELAPPVIIVGSMRSGTTRMQRLLAADPGFEALRLYESQSPVPSPDVMRAKAAGRRDPRIAQAGRILKLLVSINPAILQVHPTGPMEVDEELGLLDQSLSSAMIEVQKRIPSFARHAEMTDDTPAYRRLHRLLKLRTWFEGSDPTHPYVLKTPQHMQDIAALNAVFPQSPLIFLHRDPVQLVASGASLAWNQMVIQSDDVDPHWIGREWLHKTRHRLETVSAVRQQIPARRQFDLSFTEVGADWRGAITRTYDFLGRELTPAVLNAMQAYMDRAAREHRHAQHRYRLEQFGLEAGDVRDELSRWTVDAEPLAA
ncbi:sulfotransferase family protein [Sandaracinobacter neustonicus]|nr:sulfotransferase [Sandaracinobacter neustonicus]